MKTRQKLGQYLIYRKGSNNQNQRQSGWMPIAIVKAACADDAGRTTSGRNRPCPKLAVKIVVSTGNVDVWPNQALHALPARKASLNHWYEVYFAASELKKRTAKRKQIEHRQTMHQKNSIFAAISRSATTLHLAR